jgi:hypothetical protein
VNAATVRRVGGFGFALAIVGLLVAWFGGMASATHRTSALDLVVRGPLALPAFGAVGSVVLRASAKRRRDRVFAASWAAASAASVLIVRLRAGDSVIGLDAFLCGAAAVAVGAGLCVVEPRTVAANRPTGLAGWWRDIRTTYDGVRCVGLLLAFAGALTAASSFGAERTFGMVPDYRPGMGWNIWTLVMDGTLVASLVAVALAPALLLAFPRTLGRVLAAVVGVVAVVATPSGPRFQEMPDHPAPGGYAAFCLATVLVAVGAALCLVPPRRAATS